jgi:predicted DNA-binding transcriptional regulator AlpA
MSPNRTGGQPTTKITLISTRSKAKASQPSTTRPEISERLWTIQDASQFLNVPVNTLYQWRVTGDGPRAFKLGKHLRYDPADIRSWLETRVA